MINSWNLQTKNENENKSVNNENNENNENKNDSENKTEENGIDSDGSTTITMTMKEQINFIQKYKQIQKENARNAWLSNVYKSLDTEFEIINQEITKLVKDIKEVLTHAKSSSVAESVELPSFAQDDTCDGFYIDVNNFPYPDKFTEDYYKGKIEDYCATKMPHLEFYIVFCYK